MSKPKKTAARPAAKGAVGKAATARASAPPPVPAPSARPAAPAKGVVHAKATAPAKAAAPPKAKVPAGATRPKGAPPAPAVPAGPRKWPKGGPSKADLKRHREKLLEMRRTLLSSSQELAEEALKSSGQDFSVDHMADHGSDNYEQDFSLKLLEGEAAQLGEIRDALMKIDGKLEVPYGLCEACADESQSLCGTCPWIPASRLDVLPHARLCVQTKEIEESRRG